jgi:hypothetical protein
VHHLVSSGRIVNDAHGEFPEVGTDLTMVVGGNGLPRPGEVREPRPDHARFWVSMHRHTGLNGDWWAESGEVLVVITAARPARPGWPASWWPAREPVQTTTAHLCPIPTCEGPLEFAPVTLDEYLAAGGGYPIPSRLGSLETLVEHGLHPDDEAAIRRALLQRLVDRAALVEAVWAGRGRLPDDCCTVAYVDRHGADRALFVCDASCDHWHHDQDVWIA